MRKVRNEESYYPEIMDFVKLQIESNFYASKNPLKVYCKTGELRSGLEEIIRENNIETPSILEFASSTPPLSLDIFGLITDGSFYELLIIEVKLLKSVGLAQLSQLIGYCIVSNARYGLLVNVNGGESPRLMELLVNEPNLTCIKRIVPLYQVDKSTYNNTTIEHNLGVMEWDSDTQNLMYTGYGGIKSLSELCNKISASFSIQRAY